jgi:hypothetical protein
MATVAKDPLGTFNLDPPMLSVAVIAVRRVMRCSRKLRGRRGTQRPAFTAGCGE